MPKIAESLEEKGALPQGRYTLAGVTESGIVAICPPLSISESAFY
ncbi:MULTISPECIES: hypothetical protein [Klebsiella pneumoniae complex]|jgi:hypothetical protein|nr:MULTISPECIES: hypothetical protein [Klebsiella]MEB2940382.1 hypothetical protein [Klebsiella variicola]MEB2991687.1 hypothetical protein [Klebsiella variicola]MEC5510081.1 hypothetical protein [Klebsiella pneumoniae]MEC5601620.1 hypothetical protein [Klebsiella pneumoniae]